MAKKIQDPGSNFLRKSEKSIYLPFLLIYSKYFWLDFANSVTYYLLRLAAKQLVCFIAISWIKKHNSLVNIFISSLGYRIFRGYKELCNAAERLPDVSHIVFVVHGVGGIMDESTICRNASVLRKYIFFWLINRQ